MQEHAVEPSPSLPNRPEVSPEQIIIHTQRALVVEWSKEHPGEEMTWMFRYPVFFRQMWKSSENREPILRAFSSGFEPGILAQIQMSLDEAYGEFCRVWNDLKGRARMLDLFGKGMDDKCLHTLEQDLD